MGNPAGERRTARASRALAERQRLEAKAAAYRAAMEAEAFAWRPGGGRADGYSALRAMIERLSVRLGLGTGGPAGEAPSVRQGWRATSLALHPVAVGPSLVRIGLPNSDHVTTSSAERIAKEVADEAKLPVLFELFEEPPLPVSGDLGTPDAARPFRDPTRLERQRSAGGDAPECVLVGGQPLDTRHPPGAASAFVGTATVGARPSGSKRSPRRATHQVVTCEHVAQSVGAAVHCPDHRGAHVADVVRLNQRPTADAALAVMRFGWRTDAWIYKVGPVVAVKEPAELPPGLTYETCGRFVGHVKAKLVPKFWRVARQEVKLTSGGSFVLTDLCHFRLESQSGDARLIARGDSGAPVYYKVPGEQAAVLVGMLVAYRAGGREFLATSFPSVAYDLGVTCD